MNSSSNAQPYSTQFHSDSDDLYKFCELTERGGINPPCGLVPLSKNSTWQCPHSHRTNHHPSKVKDISSLLLKPVQDSIPTKTEKTSTKDSCPSLSSSSSEWEDCSNDSSDATFCYYESSSSSSSATSYRIPAGYQNLKEYTQRSISGLQVSSIAGQDHDREEHHPIMTAPDKRSSLLKHPSDSSPWTKATEPCSSSSSSNSSDWESYISNDSSIDTFSFDESSSPSSSDSSTASYQALDKECAGNPNSTPESSSLPVMTPQELIDVLQTVNDTDTPLPSPGFLTRDKATPPLQIEELTDLLCYINTSEKAKVEIQWDAIHNVVHGPTEECDLPFDEIDIPDDDCSTISTLSMGSCRHPKSLVLNFIQDR